MLIIDTPQLELLTLRLNPYSQTYRLVWPAEHQVAFSWATAVVPKVADLRISATYNT